MAGNFTHMRTPGISAPSHRSLTDDQKAQIVRRFITIIGEGYHAKYAERSTGRCKETVKKWAAALNIEWPKKKK